MAQDIEARPTTTVTAFGDRLAEAVERKRSQLVVGLDPRPELLPVELAATRTRPGGGGRRLRPLLLRRRRRGRAYAVAVKPQLAFFEALGSRRDARRSRDVCAYARTAGLLVIADGKRGDIGSTARAYAAAYLERRGDGRRSPTR